MASGKKNYFRHSFFARNDMKLRLLRDEIGVGFYFYFFTLLELCGESSSDELQDEYEFHNSTIRSLWGVNLKKCRTVSEKMNAVCLLEFKKGENTFKFKVPNLSKYLGRYTTKISPNSSNKKKRKESKVKEINNDKNIPSFNFDHLYQLYPKKAGKKIGVQRCESQIKSSDKYDQLKLSIENYSQQCRNDDTDRKYIKQFSTFMNCWEDYLEIEKSRQDQAIELFGEQPGPEDKIPWL